jgi:thioredoxin reductase (NADPH)
VAPERGAEPGAERDVDIAVVGGGVAGLTAALFAARHGRATVLLDPLGMGGAILNTERVEDFPGFPEGVPGFDLGPRLQQQVAEAGATFEPGEVTRIERRGESWTVVTDERELLAGAVVVATGSRSRRLGVPGEDELEGKGLSTCASCDGPLYRGKVVAMVGDGDSALLEALELTHHDIHVVLLGRNEALGGQEAYAQRVRDSAQIEVRHRTVVEAILGEGSVEAVRLRELESGASSTLPVAAVFVHVGRIPNTGLLEGLVELDERGSVTTDAWMQTALPGLFAVGDVRANAAGQAIAAAGDGATAAVAAHRYLAARERDEEMHGHG